MSAVPAARHRAPRRRDEHGARRGAPAGAARERRAPPTLRFFSWAPATDLARLRPAARRARGLAARVPRMGIGLVRRPTGGSAILHEGPELEVTYSVVARRGRFSRAPTTCSRPIGGSAPPSQRGLASPRRAGRDGARAALRSRRDARLLLRADRLVRARGRTGASWSAAPSGGRARASSSTAPSCWAPAPDRLRRVFPREADPLAGA